MEFWRFEVKPNERRKVTVEDSKAFQISQVGLGEMKNGEMVEDVPVSVYIGNKRLVLGILSSDSVPQIKIDYKFYQNLELSHGWKDGSVFFSGYIGDDSRPRIQNDEDDSVSDSNSEDEEEDDCEDDKPMKEDGSDSEEKDVSDSGSKAEDDNPMEEEDYEMAALMQKDEFAEEKEVKHVEMVGETTPKKFKANVNHWNQIV